MSDATTVTVATVTVREVRSEDHTEWQKLFRGYRDFYAQPHNEEAIATVWAWLNDTKHETRGLVAEHEGSLVGIAHFRTFARPLAASHGLFLDDLFTDSKVRGVGVASALLKRLAHIAQIENATVVRWITASDNEQAKSLYDKLATPTQWVTYDLAPGADEAAEAVGEPGSC